MERGRQMGEPTQFKGGQAAPKNSVYIEIGETGSSVQDPQQIKLAAGEKFPENTNKDRVWTYQ